MTLRMVLWKPKTILVAQVDLGGQQPVYPQIIIAFKNVSVGAYTALRGGMTVLLGTAPGKDDYGRLRYRHMHDLYPTSVMHVSRFSQGIGDGEGTLVENSYITVLEEYRVWAKVPQMIGAVIYKDGEWWSSVNAANPPPVANAGTGYAGTIDGSGKLTVTFGMGNSFKWTTSAAGGYTAQVTQWLWEVPTGTIVGGGNPTTSQSIDVEFAPGFHHIYLTVWGDDYPGGEDNKHTASVPIFVRDPANDLSTTAFHISNHTQNLVGVEITAEFFTPVARTDFPDGSLMMLWDDAIPHNPLLRLPMQFVGWHHSDDVGIRADATATLHSTRLTFYNVGRKLESLPGFSLVLEYNANPTLWSHTRHPSMFYYFWFILFWHSTALEVADLRIESDELRFYEFVILGSDRANLHEQVNSIATKVAPDHYFTTHKTGVMQIVADPMIMTQAERNANKYVMDSFTDNDWTAITYGYQRPPRVQQIRTMSMVSGHDYILVNGEEEIEIIACVAPGEAHGQGEQFLEINERMAKTQAALNAAEGNRYGRLNARYGRFNITVPWEKVDVSYDMSHMQWVELTITGANHPERELPTSFTAQKGIVHEMTVQYDYTDTGLICTATLQWEMETIGRPAQTVVLWPDAPDPTVMAARAIEASSQERSDAHA